MTVQNEIKILNSRLGRLTANRNKCKEDSLKWLDYQDQIDCIKETLEELYNIKNGGDYEDL